jgi:hypothetical protein
VLIATFAAFLGSGLGPGASPSAWAGGNTGNLTGIISDAASSAPISGATVSVGSKSAKSDANGRYTLNSVPTGTVSATATAPYYTSATQTASVTRRQTTTLNFRLSANWGSLSGTVSDAGTGSALAGATVSLSGTSQTATTDSAGRYTFAKVTAGTQNVSAAASGFQSATQSVSVPVGGSVLADFALAKSVVNGPGSTIFWNGSSTYLYGTNYAWYNYGTDFGTGSWGKFTDWNAIATHFQQVAAQGGRVVRWWVFADGRYAPDFNSDGTVSGLDSSVLSDIDRALQIAANNKVYLLLTLMDGGMWSNASFSGSVQMGGHAAIITNAAAQQSFLDNALKPLVQHVAASPNARYMLGYDIVNEPESNMSGYWGGVNLAASQVQTFVQRCATYVHTYGAGAYATVGSAMPNYVGTWKGLGLDFYQVHYYPWMDTWVSGQAPGSGLPTYASLNLDKPCIVGEFPTAAASYGLSDTNVHSARWYLDAIYTKGYAGALGWSTNVGDGATNWSAFQPVFTSWGQTYAPYVGPK